MAPELCSGQEMKKLSQIVLLITTVILAACTSSEIVNEGLRSIVLKESKDILPISSFVEKVDYVELKVMEAGIEVGEIEDVKEIGGEFLIKRRMTGNSSFMRFSKNGDFIVELSGGISSKIKEPYDIIGFGKGYAILASNGIHEVGKDGKYIQLLDRSIMQGTSFFASGQKFVVVNETDTEHVVSSYPSKNLSRIAGVSNERLRRMLYSNAVALGKDQEHVYTTVNDTIFTWHNSKLVPVYALQGDGLPTLAQAWKNIAALEEGKALRYMHDIEHIEVKNYQESRNYIYLDYWVGSAATTAIINKTNWESRYFSHGVNDIDGGVWDKVAYLTEKDELLIPISAYKISGHTISNKKVKGFDQLQKKIVDSGNPVLLRCKLR
ncbi:6-bladed beta-propeller [Maribellus sp. YY47]|uniref:6-bladed beta-propeller n=1 Tax=Maribellus sp. YY47 TaxID=2929486 RepID=UPI00200096AE|nr:6-bladed beta-propeller [Maribellus sp. YY47]MCK3684164.1 6-bladed beta-propeller [Maribellus sp. YY47]